MSTMKEKRFYGWPDTQQAHQIRTSAQKWPEILNGKSSVEYRPKQKLHGTNASVVILPDGKFYAQSRERVIPSNSDNSGFRAFVESNAEYWRALARYDGKTMVVHGEWAGSGIQDQTSIVQIGCKVFFVFAILLIEKNEEDINRSELIVNPESIWKNLYLKAYHSEAEEKIGKLNESLFVIPWANNKTYSVSWLSEEDKLKEQLAPINAEVEKVAVEDLYVKELFGVSGPGEGFVYFPASHLGRKSFSELAFKAKVEKLRPVKTKDAAQPTPEQVKNLQNLAAVLATEARLQQGLKEICGDGIVDLKKVGQFIGWISKDVQKECQVEIAASGFDWKDVAKAVSNLARNWFLSKI